MTISCSSAVHCSVNNKEDNACRHQLAWAQITYANSHSDSLTLMRLYCIYLFLLFFPIIQPALHCSTAISNAGPETHAYFLCRRALGAANLIDLALRDKEKHLLFLRLMRLNKTNAIADKILPISAFLPSF